MPSDFYYAPSKNGIQKTLSAQLLSTASTGDAISLSDVDGIQNKPGVLVINRVDSNGTATPAAREYISFTGTSGSTVLIETRNVDNSASAKTHAVGSVVEFVPDVVWAQRLIDQQLVEHSVAGVHGSAAVTSIETAAVADESPILNSSMARQAIINGNFDVWQRGTSASYSGGSTTHGYTADHFREVFVPDSGTLPTIVVSRQQLTPGDIPCSFYHYRIAPNGAGTSLGANSNGLTYQSIENGTRSLCGLNKTVTVSFYARSSIANKRFGVCLYQTYGSGGSPSAEEIINGENWTLTSTWTKYTKTFTTNTLVGKTFGTANDDVLRLDFYSSWGANVASRVGASTAESYGGSGTIDIAQVQLCAGDVALPFQPKSFEEELRACQRYYEIVGGGAIGRAQSATAVDFVAKYQVTKRSAIQVLSVSPSNPSITELGVGAKTGTASAIQANYGITTTGLSFTLNGFSGITGGNLCQLNTDCVRTECEL